MRSQPGSRGIRGEGRIIAALHRTSPVRRMISTTALALVLFVVAGNLLITAAWQIQSRRDVVEARTIGGVPNLHVVDDRVWRSAAPARSAYDDLADAGVRTIVDLRAEEDLHVDTDAMAAEGIRWVHLPIRDGQVPSDEQVATFLRAVRATDGLTLVHCGAGVGRTGAMSAAYLVATGAADGRTAMQRNLAVGPPSLEQLAFASTLDDGVHKPPLAITVASRVLDAPRRLWSRYGL